VIISVIIVLLPLGRQKLDASPSQFLHDDPDDMTDADPYGYCWDWDWDYSSSMLPEPEQRSALSCYMPESASRAERHCSKSLERASVQPAPVARVFTTVSE
jgi:hypothetical protein